MAGAPPLREYQSLLGGHSPPHHLGATYVDDMNKYHDEDALLGGHQHHHHADAGGPKDVDLGVGATTTTTTIGGFNVINRPGLAAAAKDNGMVKVEPEMSQNFNLLPPFMSD